MSIDMIKRLEKTILYLMIIALPINCLPKRFSLPGFGQNLTEYFIILALAILAYEFFKYDVYVPQKAKRYLLFYTIWSIVCLSIGLACYKYDNFFTIDQIPRLDLILDRASEIGLKIPDILSIKIWLFIRAVKRIIFIDNSALIIMLYIYHLYKKNFYNAFIDIRNSVLILVILMGVYSLIELCWLKLSLDWAEEFLKTINPYLYDVETTNTWWPPLLWNGQLRSLTREPSFFGILSIMILPFVWSYLFEKRIKIWHYFLLFYYCLMIFATNARTAIVVTLVQLLLLIVWLLICKNIQYMKSVFIIIVITAFAFGVNLINFKGMIHNQGDSISIEVMDSEAYLDNNINSIANITSRSNGARWANLLANIYVVMDHPIYGVGTGLKDAYIYEYILDIGENNQEVLNWSKDMVEKGVLRSGYPDLNKYADVAVSNGIIGLGLYLLPIIWIIYNLFKYRSKETNHYVCFLVISMLGLLAAQLSNAGFAECNGFIWGILTCYIASQYSRDGVNNEDTVY